MYYRIVSLVFCFSTIHGQAQQKEAYKKVLKIYNLSSYSQGRFVDSDSFSTNINNINSFQILHPTVAFAWKTKNSNYHEIELVDAIVNGFKNKSTFFATANPGNSAVSGGVAKSTYIRLRYEFIYEFMKDAKSDVTASVGLALQPNFIYFKTKPFSTKNFPSTNSGIELYGFVIPRINFKIDERSFVNINVPIALFDINYFKSTVRNPSVSIRSQSVADWHYTILPQNYYVRIGYAYLIE